MLPVDLPIDISENTLKEIDFRPVSAAGTFLHGHEQYLTPRHYEVSSGKREMGAHVITPFLRTSGEVVLVNRGWVPEAKRDPQTRPEGQIQGEVTINGIAHVPRSTKPSMFTPNNNPEKNTWYWLDAVTMGRLFNAKPIVIDVLKGDNGVKLPIGGQTNIKLRNEHLNYAVTWFTLSVCLSIMSFYYFKQPIKSAVRFMRRTN